MKTCARCSKEYPATVEFFHKCAKHHDGLQYSCKSCVAARRAEYYQMNADRLRRYSKDWLAANPEKAKEAARQKYIASREETLAAARRRYKNDQTFRAAKIAAAKRSAEADPERAREHKKSSRARNPESVRAARMRRRAKTKSHLTERVFAEAVSAKTGGKCYYCNTPVSGSALHIDHDVPLSRGGQHVLENLLPACRTCNQRKFTKTAEEYLKHLAASSCI